MAQQYFDNTAVTQKLYRQKRLITIIARSNITKYTRNGLNIQLRSTKCMRLVGTSHFLDIQNLQTVVLGLT